MRQADTDPLSSDKTVIGIDFGVFGVGGGVLYLAMNSSKVADGYPLIDAHLEQVTECRQASTVSSFSIRCGSPYFMSCEFSKGIHSLLCRNHSVGDTTL